MVACGWILTEYIGLEFMCLRSVSSCSSSGFVSPVFIVWIVTCTSTGVQNVGLVFLTGPPGLIQKEEGFPV